MDAARAAQSEWVVLRDRSKSEAQQEREQRGYAERAELLAACRFNLREERAAQGTLSAIAQGEGVPDLVQDLRDLAELVERHRPAFAADQSFNADEAPELARSLAAEIEAGLSSERLSTSQAAAKLLRDRAYTYLDDLVAELREAGRYAFRKDSAVAARFASAYLRRKRRRSRRAAVADGAGVVASGEAGETPAG